LQSESDFDLIAWAILPGRFRVVIVLKAKDLSLLMKSEESKPQGLRPTQLRIYSAIEAARRYSGLGR
jgi:hypothetical protein